MVFGKEGVKGFCWCCGLVMDGEAVVWYWLAVVAVRAFFWGVEGERGRTRLEEKSVLLLSLHTDTHNERKTVSNVVLRRQSKQTHPFLSKRHPKVPHSLLDLP